MSINANKTKTTRTYRTTDQWREIISEYGASGLSQTQFCKQRNLSKSSFYQWLKKCSDDSNHQAIEKAAPAFMEIQQTQPSKITWAIELEFASGMVLRIRDA